MTKNKRLIEIKKELYRIRKRIHKFNNNPNINTIKSIAEYYFPKYISAYNIIMKDGTKYIISIANLDFPNINFKDIRYVCKYINTCRDYEKNNVWINFTSKYNIYDTDKGFYNADNRWVYEKEVEAKYKVTSVLGEYED